VDQPQGVRPLVDELAQRHQRSCGSVLGAVAAHPRAQAWARTWRYSHRTHRHPRCRHQPPAIRNIIYTTNAIESLNYQLRKVTKTRGHFLTEDADYKILYLAIRNIGHTRGGDLGTGTPGWRRALNAFAIAF
jgi:transposase-like protein